MILPSPKRRPTYSIQLFIAIWPFNLMQIIPNMAMIGVDGASNHRFCAADGGNNFPVIVPPTRENLNRRVGDSIRVGMSRVILMTSVIVWSYVHRSDGTMVRVYKRLKKVECGTRLRGFWKIRRN